MASLPAGMEFRPLTGRRLELDKLFAGHVGATVELVPGGWLFPSGYEGYAREFKEFQYEEGDVMVNCFPKSGSTWVQEIIWTLLHNPDCDNYLANVPLYERSPLLETDMFLQMLHPDTPHGLMLEFSQEMTRPRVFKSHISFDLLSPTLLEKSKVVYLLRDPRDVCVSYYYHCRLFKQKRFTGSFDDFVETMLNDANQYGPYFAGVKEAWKRRNHPNLMLLSYDQLKRDPQGQIRRLAEFVGAKVSEEQFQKVIHHTSFEQMKMRESNIVTPHQKEHLIVPGIAEQDGGLFLKKGESGRHKVMLTEEHQQKFAAWIDANCPGDEYKKLLGL